MKNSVQGPSYLSEVPSKSCAWVNPWKSSCCTLWKTGVVYYLMFSEAFAGLVGRQVRVSFLTEPWMGKMLRFQNEDMIGNLRLDCCDISSPMALEGATATPHLWWNMILWAFLHKIRKLSEAKEMRDLPGSYAPPKKKEKQSDTALKFNMGTWKVGPCKRGIPLWKNIHFQVPGCCLSTLQLAANFNEAGD